MQFSFLAVLVAALVPLVMGFIWYNPKVFGTAWMKASGMTEEKMKGANMAVVFGLALVFAFLLALMLPAIVIHQMGATSLTIGSDVLPSYDAFMQDYGSSFRTFKHGALHGVLAGLFFALPIIGTNAIFERKNAKYILIHSGYWIVCLAIMGGIICAWK